MSSVVKYTFARLLLFGVAWGLLYLLGARGLLAPLLAVLISGLVSFVLLSRQRDAISSQLTGKVREMRERIDEGAAAEDASQPGAQRPDEPSETAPPASAPSESTAAESTAAENAPAENAPAENAPAESASSETVRPEAPVDENRPS